MLSEKELAEMRRHYEIDPMAYAAELTLLDEIEPLKAALSEYADEANWSSGEWMMPYKARWGVGDGSSVARIALGLQPVAV